MLTSGIIIPNGLAIDTNGNLYVANKSSDGGSQPSTILVYPPGQQAPSQVIASPMIENPGELVFDTSRDLFIGDGHYGVLEMPYGSQQPVSLGLEGFTSWNGATAVDPIDGDVFASGVSDGRQSVLGFLPGSVTSKRRLKTRAFADFLHFATIRGTEYLVVPDSGGNTVSLFKHDADKPTVVLKTVRYARDAIVKPANAP
jgi:hypothetical protein